MYAGAIRIPATSPATIKIPYTPKVTSRKEPFRFTSSECEPDSTRLSNMLSVLPNRCQIGQGLNDQSNRNYDITPSLETCLVKLEEESAEGPDAFHRAVTLNPATLRDTKNWPSQRTNHRASYL